MSAPTTALTSSAVPRAALGTAIGDYLAQARQFVKHPGGFGQPGCELLAERYYHSDGEDLEIQAATKSVISTLVRGIKANRG